MNSLIRPLFFASLFGATMMSTPAGAHDPGATTWTHHNERGHDTSWHQPPRHGFRARAAALAHAAADFRDRIAHGKWRGAKRGYPRRGLRHDARRFHELAYALQHTSRGERSRRQTLMRELSITGNRIGQKLRYVEGRKVHRRWSSVQNAFSALNTRGWADHRPVGPNVHGFNDGYYADLHDDHYSGHNHEHRPQVPGGKGHRPWNSRHVRGAVDLIEDGSERTKNAFRRHRDANRGVRKSAWARTLDGELSAFDQLANRLREAAQSRRIIDDRLIGNIVRRGQRIDNLMAGQFVGDTTRHHWTGVRNALRNFTNATGWRS